MSQIKLSEINLKTKYIGYLWYSDQAEPVLIEDELLKKLPGKTDNPFIVEGHLMTTDRTNSYMLRHNGQETVVYRYEWKKFESEDAYELDPPVTYLMKGGKEGRKIVFQRVWYAAPDASSVDGFAVLKPLFSGFRGFGK